MNWQEITLSDHIDVLTDYHANGAYEKLKANITLKYEKDFAVMIRTLNFERRDFERELIYLNEIEYEFLSKSKVFPDDILMNKIADPGSVYLMPDLGCPVSLAMNLFLIRFKRTVNQRFMYYLMYCFEPYIKLYTNGAATLTITKDAVRKLKFKVPDIKVQRKIAAILSAYDDLIESNLKRIKLLEEMAQITYEEWFVRLKFPGHETTPMDSETGLPMEWKELNIGSLIEFEIGGGWGEDEKSNEFSEPAFVIRGTDFDNLPSGDVANVPFRFHKKSNLASRKLRDGDLIFEVSGGSQNEGVAKTTIITDELLGKFNSDVMCASFCKLVRPSNKEESYLLFHFLRFLRSIKGTEVFEIRSASNIVNYNWTAFLKFQQIKLPSQKLVENFNRLAKPVHRQIYQLGKQNQLLKEARDILLPRLMTGMIDVEQLILPEAFSDTPSTSPEQEPQNA